MAELRINAADYASQWRLRPKRRGGLDSGLVFTLSRVFCYSSVAIILAAVGAIKPIVSIWGGFDEGSD